MARISMTPREQLLYIGAELHKPVKSGHHCHHKQYYIEESGRMLATIAGCLSLLRAQLHDFFK